jgi:hypothetical protein
MGMRRQALGGRACGEVISEPPLACVPAASSAIGAAPKTMLALMATITYGYLSAELSTGAGRFQVFFICSRSRKSAATCIRICRKSLGVRMIINRLRNNAHFITLISCA